MRGKVWELWMDAWLCENYADRENRELAAESGYGLRTIERHAGLLGLRKSAEFIREHQRQATADSKRWYEYMRITGQKVKNSGCSGRRFGKGFRWDEATEAKRVAALQARSWEDRKRIIHGIKPIAKWKYKKFE